MRGQVNIAIVGCGGMAQQYLSVYRDLPWVRVHACIDTDLLAARRAATMLKADVVTGEFAEALSQDTEAVIINTPNHLHREQAIAAMKAGKHTLLQKPVAPTLADAEAIAEVAASSSVISGLYMSYFDQPWVYELRDLLRAGAIGEPVHFYAQLMHKGGLILSAEAVSGKRSWRTSLRETGGGCFIQLAVHYIHLFRWFSGSRIAAVVAMMSNLHSPGIEGEDLASVVLRFESGSTATLDTAWCTTGEQFAIHGTLGRIEYHNNRWLSMASSHGPYRGRLIDYPGVVKEAFDGLQGVEHNMEMLPRSYGDASNPYNQQAMFLKAVRNRGPAFCSIASGVEDLRVVNAAYESAERGCAVELTLERNQDAARHRCG